MTTTDAAPGPLRRFVPIALLLGLGTMWGASFSMAKIATTAGAHPLGLLLWQAGGGVFQRHRPGQPGAFLQRHVGRHARATDRWTGSDVVHHQDRPQSDLRIVDVDDLVGAKIIHDGEDVAHQVLLAWSIGVNRPARGPPAPLA